MYEIAICNLQHTVDIHTADIERTIVDALQSEQVAGAELSVALVDDERMQVLNRTHLGHDYPTDVLSFLLDVELPSGETASERVDGGPGRGKRLDGELIISVETAERQARRQGVPTGDEILLYAVHGVLHLCGHDDATDGDRERMRRREADILQIRGVTPHYE